MPDEFIEYAITITVNKRCNDLLPHEQVDRIMSDMSEHSKYVNYDLIFELTKQGNVHAHGFIQMKRNIFSTNRYQTHYYSNKVQIQCLFKRNKNIGFVMVVDITDREGWIEYITKNVMQFKKDCPDVISATRNYNMIDPIAYEKQNINEENIDIDDDVYHVKEVKKKTTIIEPKRKKTPKSRKKRGDTKL